MGATEPPHPTARCLVTLVLASPSSGCLLGSTQYAAPGCPGEREHQPGLDVSLLPHQRHCQGIQARGLRECKAGA